MHYLKYQQEGEIGVIEFYRPEVLNAVNAEALHELIDFVENQALRDQLKALILTGSGDKAFIAGADIKEMHLLNTKTISDFSALGQRACRALEDAMFLTIAAINGYTLGGGFEIALSCDLIYAVEQATMGMPEVSLGLIPGFGGIQRLIRAVGVRRAKELIMTAETIDAGRAKELGIVNGIFDPLHLIEKCKEVAKGILQHSFFSVMQIKLAAQEALEIPRKESLEMERHLFAMCFDTKECKERLDSFFHRAEGRQIAGSSGP